jgi:hypothetical protein
LLSRHGCKALRRRCGRHGAGSDAQADLATLQKMNPELAKDLAEFMKTGKEEDQLYGLSTKIRQ